MAMLALALLWVASDPSITLESTGLTVSALCERLGQQTGHRFRTFGDVRDDLIAVRLTGVPLSAVLDKLAYVERAKVERTDAGYDVGPDELVRTRESDARYRKKLGIVKRGTAEWRVRLASAWSTEAAADSRAEQLLRDIRRAQVNRTDQSYASIQQAADAPFVRAAIRSLQAIPSEEIARMAPGSSELWSTAPLAGERLLEVDGDELLASLRSEGRVWNSALSKAGAEERGSGWLAAQEHPYDSIADLKVFVRAGLFGKSWEVVMDAFDRDGKRVWLEGVDLYEPPPPPARTPLESRLAKATIPAEELGAQHVWCRWANLVYGDELKSVRERFLKSEFVPKFLDPVRYDPMSFILGRPALELAQARSKRLIARLNVCTAEALWEGVAVDSSIDLNRVESILDGEWNPNSVSWEFVDQDDWMTLRSEDPEEDAKFEFSGRALKSYLDGIRRSGVRDSNLLAQFAGQSGRDWEQFYIRWVVPWTRILFPDANPSLDIPEFGGIRLLSLLSPEQYGAALRDGLSLATCSAEQLEALRHSGFRCAEPRASDLLQLRAIAVRWLLPAGGVLRIRTIETPAVRIRYTLQGGKGWEGTWNLRVRDAVRMGYLRTNSEGWKLPPEEMVSIRPIRSVTYTLTFTFPGEPEFEPIRVQVEDFAGDAVKQVSQLPDALQEAIRQENDEQSGGH